jgi:hypothetical protein
MFHKITSPSLKGVLLLLILGCLWLAASAVGEAVSGNWLPLAVAMLLWLPLAWGLWHLHPLARRIAVVLLWLVVIVLPIGVINPFAAMDGAVDIGQSLWRLILPLAALEAVALYMLHVLGKYRGQFTSGITGGDNENTRP